MNTIHTNPTRQRGTASYRSSPRPNPSSALPNNSTTAQLERQLPIHLAPTFSRAITYRIAPNNSTSNFSPSLSHSHTLTPSHSNLHSPLTRLASTTPPNQRRKLPSAVRRNAHLFQWFGGDPNRTVHRNAGTGKNSGEQVALVSAGFWQETTRMKGTASPACQDEGQVLPRV